MPWASAAPPPDILRIELDPLIETAAEHPARFAVDVPVAIGIETHGEWSADGDFAVWRYVLRLPSAISMAFHASRIQLPAGARLFVSGGGRQFLYDGRSTVRGDLWSDLLEGDTIELELRVPAALRGDTALQLGSLQAGYRALAQGQRNHPGYDAALQKRGKDSTITRRLVILAGERQSEACARNYQCHTELGNADSAAATVAIVIRNMFLCTGTLINDVPGSETPFVLTARHCQGGSGPGGDPGAAADTRYYWNAVDACGSSLSSVFTASMHTQFGATTEVEQEDLWLLRLQQPPPVEVAAFAGWDATGAAFVGGFSSHHAAARTRQITVWHSTPLLATFVTPWYSSRVWRTTNAFGNIGHGASGGAFFDPAGRSVGVLSRGAFASGNTDDYGVCPTSPLLPPTETLWAGEFVALGPIWNSTADSSSTTNPRTIRSVLDPLDTGALVVDPIAVSPPIGLSLSNSPSGSSFPLGVPITLTWSTQNATICQASGGGPGSAWGGSVPVNGSLSLTETVDGTYTYSLTCSNAQRVQTRQLAITWTIPPAHVVMTADPPGDWAVGTSVTLSWNSNVADCVASGGFAGDGWAGSRAQVGSHVVRSDVPDSATFTITCGTEPRSATAWLLINWPEMSAFVAPNDPVPAQIRIGQVVNLRFSARAASCQGVGGAPGDGWSGPRSTYGEIDVSSSVAGTFTYRYECVSGPNTASHETNLTWVDAPPAVTLTADPMRQQVNIRSSNNIQFTWLSNVKPCRLDFTGPQSGLRALNLNFFGSRLDSRAPGFYQYTISCGTGAAAASASVDVEWYLPPAAVTMQVVPAPGQPPFYPHDGANLTWSANIEPCNAAGGGSGDSWPGFKGPQSSLIVRPAQSGTYVYDITCGPTGNQASASVGVRFEAPPAPIFDRFISSPVAPVTGGFLDLIWDVRHADHCDATGGYPGDTWPGPKNARRGTVFVAAPVPGIVRYTLTCSNAAGSTTQHVDVTWTGTSIAFASISAQPATVILGESSRISWWSERATSCEASGGTTGDGWAGTRAPSGSLDIAMTEIGVPQFSLRCADSRWVSTQVRVNAAPAPVVSVTVSPSSIPLGASSTISWNVTGAASCQASGAPPDVNPAHPWQGALPASGGRTVSPLGRGTFSYLLTCTAPGALTQASGQLTVTDPVNPLVTFSIDPRTVVQNGFYNLNWDVIGATTCSASGGVSGDGWSGVLPHTGTRSIRAGSPGTFTYGIECASATGATSAQGTVTVTVSQPPPGGGGGGGGGAVGAGLLWLFALGLLAARGTASQRVRAAVRSSLSARARPAPAS